MIWFAVVTIAVGRITVHCSYKSGASRAFPSARPTVTGFPGPTPLSFLGFVFLACSACTAGIAQETYGGQAPPQVQPQFLPQPTTVLPGAMPPSVETLQTNMQNAANQAYQQAYQQAAAQMQQQTGQQAAGGGPFNSADADGVTRPGRRSDGGDVRSAAEQGLHLGNEDRAAAYQQEGLAAENGPRQRGERIDTPAPVDTVLLRIQSATTHGATSVGGDADAITPAWLENWTTLLADAGVSAAKTHFEAGRLDAQEFAHWATRQLIAAGAVDGVDRHGDRHGDHSGEPDGRPGP